MPSILGANTLSSGFDVANSVRLEGRSSSTRMEYTAGSASNRRTWTWSAWIKRSTEDSASNFQVLFSSTPTGPAERIMLENDFLTYDHDKAGTDFSVRSTRLLRDFSAWYHVVVMKDTTQGTETNRIKMYINGVQETLVEVQEGFPGQNLESTINTAAETQLFAQADGEEFGGYACEVAFCDGQSLAASDFGEFDEDSPTIWKPKDISDLTFGTNGYYLKFEDSSALGADSSGNGNNYATANLATTDQSTDTCTNNFATLNPLIIFGSNNSEFKEGNLVYDDSRGDWRAAVGTFGASSGKWYYEIKLGGGTYHQVGIVGTTSPTSSANLIDLSQVHGGFSFYTDNGNLIARTDGSTISGWASGNVNTTAQTNDILQVALDMDNKYIYFGKAGTFVKSGDPTSGSTGTGGIDISSDYTTGVVAIPGVTMYNGSDGSLNFGSPAFAISSGNSDANGHGNFEYAVPSGYFALCTKNLAEHG